MGGLPDNKEMLLHTQSEYEKRHTHTNGDTVCQSIRPSVRPSDFISYNLYPTKEKENKSILLSLLSLLLLKNKKKNNLWWVEIQVKLLLKMLLHL